MGTRHPYTHRRLWSKFVSDRSPMAIPGSGGRKRERVPHGFRPSVPGDQLQVPDRFWPNQFGLPAPETLRRHRPEGTATGRGAVDRRRGQAGRTGAPHWPTTTRSSAAISAAGGPTPSAAWCSTPPASRNPARFAASTSSLPRAAQPPGPRAGWWSSAARPTRWAPPTNGSASGRWRASPLAGQEMRRAPTGNTVCVSPPPNRPRRAASRPRGSVCCRPNPPTSTGGCSGIGQRTQNGPPDWDKPLAGKVRIVTGAGARHRGMHRRVFARDGASVLAVDVVGGRGAGRDRVAGGRHRPGTGRHRPDAVDRITATCGSIAAGGPTSLVNNASITRDKLLANMDDARWDSVIAVNLVAPLRLTRDSSATAASAGQPGDRPVLDGRYRREPRADQLRDHQAGMIGMGRSHPSWREGHHHQRGGARVHRNRDDGRHPGHPGGGPPAELAVPGRQAGGRRQTIAFFASPASNAVTGNVIRVCGQAMLGA